MTDQTHGTNPITFELDELVRSIVRQAINSHQHTWIPVAVGYPKQQVSINPRMARPTEDVTFVLLKCECGEPRSFTLDGTWTEEQIKMEVPVGSSNNSTRSPSGPERDDGPSGEYPPGR